jgi:hypothetical protein
MSSDSRRDRRRGIASFLLASGAMLLAGALLPACPGSLDNPEDFVGPTADIIGPRCATAACHDAHSKAGGLDLTPDANLKKRIIDVPGTGPGCTGKYVDTAAPEMSLIYTKCTPMKICGSQMPLTGNPLTQDELDELLMWVQSLK